MVVKDSSRTRGWVSAVSRLLFALLRGLRGALALASLSLASSARTSLGFRRITLVVDTGLDRGAVMVTETLGLDTLVTGDITLVLRPQALGVTDTLPAGPPTQHYPVLTGLASVIPVAKMGSGVNIRFTF